MSTNYVDLFVFVFLLFEFFVGINRGAILFIFDILGIFLGFLLANLLTPFFSSFLINNFHLERTISEKILSFIVIPDNLGNVPASVDSVSKAISQIKLPKLLENFILSNGVYSSLNVKEFISLKLSQYIVNVISFVAIFVAILLLVRVIGLVIRNLLRVSPFLKWIDVILGGVVRVAVTFAVVSILIHMIGFVFAFLDLTKSSFFEMLVKSRTYYISETYFSIISTYFSSLIANFK